MQLCLPPVASASLPPRGPEAAALAATSTIKYRVYGARTARGPSLWNERAEPQDGDTGPDATKHALKAPPNFSFNFKNKLNCF